MSGCGITTACQHDSDCHNGAWMQATCLPKWGACSIDPHWCCDSCSGSGADCVAIYFSGADRHFNIWTGSGDFIPGTGSDCPPLEDLILRHAHDYNSSNEKDYTYFHDSFTPALTADGKLESGKRETLDLGRPGSCAAHVGVSVVGHVFSINARCSTVGECCDLCSKDASCTAWQFRKRSCTLIDSDEGDLSWRHDDEAFADAKVRELVYN